VLIALDRFTHGDTGQVRVGGEAFPVAARIS
jgi:hypothetical protein